MKSFPAGTVCLTATRKEKQRMKFFSDGKGVSDSEAEGEGKDEGFFRRK